MKKFSIFASLSVLVAAFVASVAPVQAAGSASFSMTPGSASKNINETVSFTIYENGTDVNVVTAKLSYDASKLQFQGISAAGSGFAGDAYSAGGSGAVEVSRYAHPAVSGSQKVATVSFKALSGSGSTTVSFTSGSKIASNGSDVWNGVTPSSTVSFTTPAAPSNPSTGGGSTPSNTDSGSTASNNSANTSTNTKKVATNNSNTAQAATSDQTFAESTTGEVKDDTTTKDDKKSEDAKKDDEKKTSDNGSAWYEILAMIIAASLAFLAGRRYRAHRLALKERMAQEAAAAAAAAKAKKASEKPAKKAADKPKNKTAKKKNKK